MSQKIITFAGVPGCGKTPVASYLSWKLRLPTLNNDAMRSEVSEDLLYFSEVEYVRRRDTRISELLGFGQDFIYDASVDRSWATFSPRLAAYGYEQFIISFDLSREYIENLYAAKGYRETFNLSRSYPEHEAFLAAYGDVVNTSIRDDIYSQRLELALTGAKIFIG